jgi:hypothetical protein
VKALSRCTRAEISRTLPASGQTDWGDVQRGRRGHDSQSIKGVLVYFGSDPSPVTLRLMKAPERDTLSPRERVGDRTNLPNYLPTYVPTHVSTYCSAGGFSACPLLPGVLPLLMV